jgi:hypothetical protein
MGSWERQCGGGQAVESYQGDHPRALVVVDFNGGDKHGCPQLREGFMVEIAMVGGAVAITTVIVSVTLKWLLWQSKLRQWQWAGW